MALIGNRKRSWHARGIERRRLLLESAGALLAEEQVDELLLYVAPRLIGPQGRPLAELPALAELQDSPWFVMMDVCQVGVDLRLRLRPKGR